MRVVVVVVLMLDHLREVAPNDDIEVVRLHLDRQVVVRAVALHLPKQVARMAAAKRPILLPVMPFDQ